MLGFKTIGIAKAGTNIDKHILTRVDTETLSFLREVKKLKSPIAGWEVWLITSTGLEPEFFFDRESEECHNILFVTYTNRRFNNALSAFFIDESNYGIELWDREYPGDGMYAEIAKFKDVPSEYIDVLNMFLKMR